MSSSKDESKWFKVIVSLETDETAVKSDFQVFVKDSKG